MGRGLNRRSAVEVRLGSGLRDVRGRRLPSSDVSPDRDGVTARLLHRDDDPRMGAALVRFGDSPDLAALWIDGAPVLWRRAAGPCVRVA
jgi:hypothetical protein